MINIKDLLAEINIGVNYIAKFKQRLKNNGICIYDNYYISDEDAAIILKQAEEYGSLNELVIEIVKSTHKIPNEAKLIFDITNRIKQLFSNELIKASSTFFSYNSPYAYFYKSESKEKITNSIKVLISINIEYQDESGFLTLKLISDKYQINEKTLLDIVNTNTIKHKVVGNLILVNSDDFKLYLHKQEAWKELNHTLKSNLKTSDVKMYKNEIMESEIIKFYKEKNFIIKKEETYYYHRKIEKKLIEQIQGFINELKVSEKNVSIYVSARTIGIPISILRERIDLGHIDARLVNDRYYLSTSQIKTIIDLKNSYTGINVITKELANECLSKFDNRLLTNRENLENYLQMNNFYNIEFKKDEDIAFEKYGVHNFYIRNSVIDKFKQCIRQFIIFYGLNEEERYKKILQHKNSYTEDTLNLFIQFIRMKEITKSINDVLHLIIFNLEKEIFELYDSDIKKLIKVLETAISKKILLDFLCFVGRRRKVKYGEYRLQKVESGKFVKEAYGYSEIIELAICIFDEKYINENKLIDKAIEKSLYVEIWLFASIHFVCGWRSVDIISNWCYLNLLEGIMNQPFTIMESDKIFKAIKNGEITDKQYEDIADYVIEKIKYKREKPSKTRKINPGDLRIEVLPSLKKHFGMLVLIAEGHKLKNGNGYMVEVRMSSYKNRINWSNFFGNNVKKVLGNRNFSSTSMNKSFLQAHEKIARDRGWGEYTAFMIAALARSHKIENLRLPTSTENYLEDGNFTGEDAKIIMHEMFERGILGFIPYKLLMNCFPNEFSKLSYCEQTYLIKMTGLDVVEIDTIIKGYSVVKKIEIDTVIGKKEQINNRLMALHNISNGYGISKDKGCFCMRRAINYSCNYPERRYCIGCESNIITVSGLPAIVNSYKFYKQKYIETGNPKYRIIMNKVILPTIKDVLDSFQQNLESEEKNKLLGELKGLMIND